MTARGATKAWSGILDQAALLLSWVSGICLLFLVIVISSGVVMRYAFRQPIMGVNEIVELAAVALVMAALPYCTGRGDHVAVDVFNPVLGRWGRFAGDMLWRLLSGFVLIILCQRAVFKAMDALEWGDATNMLGMPIWPFYATLAAGVGLSVLVLAGQLLVAVFEGPGE